MTLRIFKIFFLSLLTLSFFSCSKPTNEIRIGFFGPLTGSTATWGQMGKKAVDLAVEEVNAQGGLLGKQVKVIYEDDQSLPEQAKIAALKLIKQHKVSALIGEYASSRSLAAAPEAQRNKIPMVSPFSTNPKVTAVGDYIFRVCYIDPFQGSAMAHFAYDQLGVRSAAILRDIKNDYSIGLANYFIETFTKLGGKIVADHAYSEGDVEFRSQLTATKASNPQAIFIPGYYTEVGLIARQTRELGMNIPLLGGDGWDSTKTVDIGGNAANNSYFSTPFAADDPNPAGQMFIKNFQLRYALHPDGTAAVSYEAAMDIFDAIKREGSTDGKAIRDALAATKDYDGVSGKMSLDKDRNAIKRIVIMKIEDQKLQFHSAVEPS